MFDNPNDFSSRAKYLNHKRGKAPKGMRFISSSVYMPAGKHKNVEDSKIRNPKVAANVQMMHDKWYEKKFGTKESV